MLEDDAYFVLAAYYNGVAHPPGYPIYTLLGHLFTYIPSGSIAFNVHLASAFFGSVSCLLLWLIVSKLTGSRTQAAMATLILGLSQVFWSQAIIAEVYTLNVFFFLLLFLLAIHFKHSATKNSLFRLSLVYGLALSNHWPLIILSTPALLLLLWPHKAIVLKHVLAVFFGIVLGLSPYVWMVINSLSMPVISFFGPIDSWSDFWFYLSRQAYKAQDLSITAGIYDKAKFIQYIFSEIILQFGYVGLFSGLLGFTFQWIKLPGYICWALLLGFVGNTLLLVLILGFDYDIYHQSIFRVYPLIAYAIFSFWISIGLYVIAIFTAEKNKN